MGYQAEWFVWAIILEHRAYTVTRKGRIGTLCVAFKGRISIFLPFETVEFCYFYL